MQINTKAAAGNPVAALAYIRKDVRGLKGNKRIIRNIEKVLSEILSEKHDAKITISFQNNNN